MRPFVKILKPLVTITIIILLLNNKEKKTNSNKLNITI